MNYIKHTVAAHEHLRARPEASPLHVALYWALFFAWNAEYFDHGIDLDHDAAMLAAHIGNRKTYRATLYDLEAWGLLSYQPSRSRHHPSRCVLTDLSGAKVPPVNQPTEGRSAPDETSLPGAEVPPIEDATEGNTAPDGSFTGGTSAPTLLIISNSLLSNSDVANSAAAATQKKRGGEKTAGEELSEAQVLDDGPTPPGAAPKKKVAAKKMRVKHLDEGVHQATIRAAATAQANDTAGRTARRGRAQRPEVPFTESTLARYEDFAAAFAGTDYELADLRFYHAKILAWRDRKTGEPPRRRDWKTTATQFFLNDAHENRLKLAPGVQRPDPANPGPGNAGSGPARSGYVSKWDR